MLWCVSVAPLGKPVVPEVYWMLIGSSHDSDASRAASSRGRVAAAGVGERGPAVLEGDGLAQRRQARAHLGDHGAVVARAKGARVEQQARRRLRERVLDLGGLVGRVEVDEDGAGAGAGELRDHPLVAIGRPQADAIAAGDAVGEETAGDDRRLVGQRAPRGAVALRAHDERIALAEAGGSASERAADGVSQKRRVADRRARKRAWRPVRAIVEGRYGKSRFSQM